MKQKIYQIGNFKIGGQPGELPTLLIGNVFYKGMPEVSNHKEGGFDKKAVLKWIRLAETFSEKSGVPHFLDVMAMYPEAIREYVAFVVEQTSAPFLIDGANSETRIAALETVKQLGLEKQVIFNGITPKTSQEELVALRDSGVDVAVLMAFNEFDYSPEGRISILKGSVEQVGLFSLAEKAGVEKMLVDTIVFDVPSISYAAEAIKLVKKELGYPAGCSPANATYSWKQALKGSVLREGFAASNVSAHTITQCWGADFLIYGPIKQAKNMIPACAINDAIIAYYAMKRFGIKPLVKSHPLYRVF
jgi:tetrahydromethanopterin S-methyltransferase subunit H